MKNDNLKIMTKMVLNHFFIITTILLFVFGLINFIVYFKTPNNGTLCYTFPLQVIAVSLPCACCSFLYYSKKEYGKNSFLIRCLIHFFLLIGIVCGEGFAFGWIDEFIDFLVVFSIFLIVYLIVWFTTIRIDKRNSDMINKALHNKKEKESLDE